MSISGQFTPRTDLQKRDQAFANEAYATCQVFLQIDKGQLHNIIYDVKTKTLRLDPNLSKVDGVIAGAGAVQHFLNSNSSVMKQIEMIRDQDQFLQYFRYQRLFTWNPSNEEIQDKHAELLAKIERVFQGRNDMLNPEEWNWSPPIVNFEEEFGVEDLSSSSSSPVLYSYNFDMHSSTGDVLVDDPVSKVKSTPMILPVSKCNIQNISEVIEIIGRYHEAKGQFTLKIENGELLLMKRSSWESFLLHFGLDSTKWDEILPVLLPALLENSHGLEFSPSQVKILQAFLADSLDFLRSNLSSTSLSVLGTASKEASINTSNKPVSKLTVQDLLDLSLFGYSHYQIFLSTLSPSTIQVWESWKVLAQRVSIDAPREVASFEPVRAELAPISDRSVEEDPSFRIPTVSAEGVLQISLYDIHDVAQMLETYFKDPDQYYFTIKDGQLLLMKLSFLASLSTLLAFDYTAWDKVVQHIALVLAKDPSLSLEQDENKALQRLVRTQLLSLKADLPSKSIDRLETAAKGKPYHALTVLDILEARKDDLNFTLFLNSVPNRKDWEAWLQLAEVSSQFPDRFTKVLEMTDGARSEKGRVLTAKELTAIAVSKKRANPHLVLEVQTTPEGEKYLEARALTFIEKVDAFMKSPIQDAFHVDYASYIHVFLEEPNGVKAIERFHKATYSQGYLNELSQSAILRFGDEPTAHILRVEFDNEGRRYLVAKQVEKLTYWQRFLHMIGVDLTDWGQVELYFSEAPEKLFETFNKPEIPAKTLLTMKPNEVDKAFYMHDIFRTLHRQYCSSRFFRDQVRKAVVDFPGTVIEDKTSSSLTMEGHSKMTSLLPGYDRMMSIYGSTVELVAL